MKEIIQRLMVYVIIVSALKGLLTNEKYEEYFRFFSGWIMLLMLLFPVLSIFHSSSGWYQKLEEKFFDMDISEIQGTLKVADGGFEKVLLKEYSEALKKEVLVMAKEEKVVLQDAKVVLKKNKDEIYIAEISGGTGKKDPVKDAVVIETIQIGKKTKDQKKKEDDSKKVKKLRKKICSRFSLAKEQVHLWE